MMSILKKFKNSLHALNPALIVMALCLSVAITPLPSFAQSNDSAEDIMKAILGTSILERIKRPGRDGNDATAISNRPDSAMQGVSPNSSESGAQEGEVKRGGVDRSDLVLQPPDHTVQESSEYVASINSGLTSAATQLAATVSMVEPLLGNTVMQVSQDSKLHLGNVYSAQDSFIKATEQMPTTREFNLRAFSGCTKKRSEEGDGNWTNAVASCLGSGGQQPFSPVDHPASPSRTGIDDGTPEGVLRLSHLVFSPAINLAAEQEEVDKVEWITELKKYFINYIGDAEFENVASENGALTIDSMLQGINPEIGIDKLIADRTQEVYMALGRVMEKRCRHNLEALGSSDVQLTDDYNPFAKRDFWTLYDNSDINPSPAEIAAVSADGFDFDTIKGQLLFALAERDTQLKNPNAEGFSQMDCGFLGGEFYFVYNPEHEDKLAKYDQARLQAYRRFAELVARSRVYSELRILETFLNRDVVPLASSTYDSGAMQKIAIGMIYEVAKIEGKSLSAMIEEHAEKLKNFFTELSKKEASESGQLSGAVSKTSRQQGGIKDPLGGN